MSAETRYIHIAARQALHAAYVQANLKPVIAQTQGGVEASAGTHLSEGTYENINDNGEKYQESYSACIDFSVNHKATRISDGAQMDMDRIHIEWFLQHMSERGFAGWYRTPVQGFVYHIHVVCAMVPITRGIVRRQIVDFVTGKNGLKSHDDEIYWHATDVNDAIVAKTFAKANPQYAHLLPQHLLQ